MLDWNIHLLGGVETFRTSKPPLKFHTRQGGLLLAFLAVHPNQEHLRSELAGRFWPEASSELTARQSVSMELSSFRKGFREDFDKLFITTKSTIGLRGALLFCDAIAFEKQLRPNGVERMAALHKALELYKGEFLPGAAEPDPQWPWLEPTRRRLHVLQQNALAELASLYEAQEDRRSALDYALRITDVDALLPQHQQALIRIVGSISTGQPLAPSMSSESLSPREVTDFLKRLEERGETPRDEERQRLRAFLMQALARLSEPERHFLITTTVFPDSFSKKQAESVTGYSRSGAFLRNLRQQGLVEATLTTPKRYRIPVAIHELIAPLLEEPEKRKLQDRLACWLYTTMRGPDQWAWHHPGVEDHRWSTVWAAAAAEFKDNVRNLDETLKVQLARSEKRATHRAFKLVRIARFFWPVKAPSETGEWEATCYWDCAILEHMETLPPFQRPRAVTHLGLSTLTISQLPPCLVALIENVPHWSQFLPKEPQVGHYIAQFAVLAHTAELDQAALELFAQAYDLIPSDTPESRTRRAWMLRSYYLTRQTHGDLHGGLPYLQEALSLVEGTDEAPQTQEFLADALAFQGRFAEAEQHYEVALDYQFQHGCWAAQMQVLRAVGYCHLHRGQLVRAQLAFQHAITLNPDERDQVSDCLRGIGMVALYRGNFEEALGCFQQGIVVWQEREHARWQAVFLLLHAYVSLLLERDEDAKHYLRQAEEQLTKTKSPSSSAYALYLQGTLAFREGDTARAIQLYTEALEQRRRFAAFPQQLDSLEELARALASCRDLAEARGLYQEAMQLRAEHGIPVPPFRQASLRALEALLQLPEPQVK